MKAFFLGAGATRGTFDEREHRVPVAAEFGATLARDPGFGLERDYRELFKVVAHLSLDPKAWPLEPVWSCIDYYAKLFPALAPHNPWPNASPQLKMALLAVYGSRCDAQAELVKSDSTLFSLIKEELQAGDALISFNYDTIAEHIADGLGRQLRPAKRDGDGQMVMQNEHIIFAKPHGSTSWKIDLNSRLVMWQLEDKPPLLHSLTDEDINRNVEPFVLGAVPIKSELIREVQGVGGTCDVFRAILDQWRMVVEAIFFAEEIIVVGYSFPQEDQYGRFLVQEALRWRARERKKRLRIEFFEVEDKEAERATVLSCVFRGHIRELVFRGPVKPGK